MTTHPSIELARMVRNMAARHEDSWASQATESHPHGHYALDLADMSQETPLSYPVYLLLKYNWNDALDWADRVLDGAKAASEAAAEGD